MSSGAYIFGCKGLALNADEIAFFRDSRPWGFILFSRNIDTPAQLSALTQSLRDVAGWQVPILIDQEGGRVQRLGPPHWRQYPPALDQVNANRAMAERAMFLRNRLIADELLAAGIDVNCAPLADVIRPESHPVLRNRCYGDDPEIVTRLCRAAEKGLLEGGVLPVLKHIPGYGRAVVDSHIALPRVDVDRATLDAVDFAPFRALNDMAIGMTAHIVFSCIDTAPATTSPAAMRVIREDIGFDGLIMTDDISMAALAGTLGERGTASLQSGCDLVLHCNGDLAEMREIAESCGDMTPAAADRASRALAQRQAPVPVDIGALEAEFLGLISR